MQEERENVPSAGQIADTARNTAHTIQAAQAVLGAAKGGVQAAGAAVGTALGGPLGTVVAAIVTSKTFRRILAAVAAFIFLWLFIIVNFIGIILSYLGFASADDFARQRNRR